MNITNEIIKSCNNTLPMFGFEPEFAEEVTEKNLNSAEEVNILIGLSNGAQGNIVISFNKETALEIVSTMMGGIDVEDLGDIGESALGEVSNMLIGTAISSVPSEGIIEISPPTIITGKDMYLMISNVVSQKLSFKLGNSNIYISYVVQ